ncbi:MAG TPA: UDP-N-acetylmuramate--L-alanine ligase [Longimicrobiales bacterium]|nr:UDP-N-acetylmuramate--L-alanine ligase [Longimicrobiales bacterium]
MTSTHDWRSVDVRALARTGVVHFMGIAGAGMSALAELVARSGGTVTGCDLRPGAAMAAMREHGIPVATGHDAAHVSDAAALVVTSAVMADHPEVAAARARGIPVLKRAQLLGAMVNAGTLLAVAGTHGKTTTTAATTSILDAARLSPTGIVGGRMAAWGGGLRAGTSDIYVVEADEYDRSFLTLEPAAAVVTNVEPDHLDIYGDLAGLEDGFVAFIGQVRDNGLVAICADDAGARRVAGRVQRDVLTYGTGMAADLRATAIEQDGRAMTFTVVEQGNTLGTLTVATPGVHNVRNALGAFALARHAGATFDDARTALSAFTGVSRRFQEVGTARAVTVIDDYAHHPTEITATLTAARGMFPSRRIVAVFQPHLYSRTRDLSEEFGQALAAADTVWVTDVYAAREQPLAGITGELVARAARAAGAEHVQYVPQRDELFAQLQRVLSPGDVVVAMGAGDIDEATHALFANLARGVTP